MKLIYILLASFIIFFNSCKSQVNDVIANGNNTFDSIKSEYLQEDFIIGLILMDQTSKYHFDNILSSKEIFISITKSYFEFAKLDSFNRMHTLLQLSSKVNSPILKQKFYSFVDNYKIVTSLIFSRIDDDDEKALMDIGNRIMQIKDAGKIYRIYLTPKQNIASLTSYTGIALNIHLAYYLSTLDTEERKRVIKQLL